MSSWPLLAFVAPALWATCNYIDKYLVSKFFSEKDGTSLIMILAGVISIVISLAIGISGVDVFSTSNTVKIVLVINGLLGPIAMFPYYWAIKQEHPIGVVPIFQTIPIFSYFLGLIFLHEQLTGLQIAAGLLVVGGAVGLSLELKEGLRFKYKPFLLMLLSSFILAVSSLIFKKVTVPDSYWVSNFWEYSSFGLATLTVLIFSRKYRAGFFGMFDRTRYKGMLLSTLEEGLNTVGGLAYAFAILLAPLAVVSVVVNGLQPFYVFIFGVMLAYFFPKLIDEKQGKIELAQKLFFILVIFAGTYLLSRAT